MEKEFIHLCQPDGKKSCAACCGLYNYADSRKEALQKRLAQRTRLFHEIVRGWADLSSFSEKIKQEEDQAKLYEVIYCCEYLGFLDADGTKVGCLLHPRQNGGEDLRGVSFYGRELCDGHFCPSYHYISGEEKRALIEIINDWYLFGLVMTDIDLVKEYFRLVSEAVGEMPSHRRFRDPRLRDIAHRFFRLKVDWPFRSPDANRFGKYYFDGSQYMIRYIDYESLGCEKSRFDRIFMSLSSVFQDQEALRAAEKIIDENLREFIGAYTGKH
jgi:hypothetical protein